MASETTLLQPSKVPGLRAEPEAADDQDTLRANFLIDLWRSQDQTYRQRDRQIEENLRVLSGQQWIVWSELRQRYVDVTMFMSDEERRWRHLPVLNRVFLWHMLTHARFTENPPVITFQAGPDRIDGELAEVMDPIFKWLWQETEMIGVLDEGFAWLIPCGEIGLKSVIDPTAGDLDTYEGEAILQLLGANGQPVQGPDGPIQRLVEGAPYNAQGEVQGRLVPFEDDFAFESTGDPYRERTGALRVDVVPPFDYRGEWGVREWHRKRWHIHRMLLTQAQFYERYGFETETDTDGQDWLEVGTLFNMVFGSGSWGAASGRTGGQVFAETTGSFVTVYDGWFAPSRLPGMEQTKDSAGGRHLVVTGKKVVVRDGVRPCPYKWTSPIRRIGFVNLPGRPSFSTPQEMLNGALRTRNRLDAQGLEHATRVANPIQVIDKDAGVTDGQITNLPGQQVYLHMGRRETRHDPISYVQPPNLQESFWRMRATLTEEFDTLASLPGSQGSPPTADASGELVKELRFNSDRFVGPTARRTVIEMGRMALDWQCMLPLLYTEEKLIRIAGDDNIGRTVLLLPEVLKTGNVNVVPELESMLPEGRGERRQRVKEMWQSGAWGDPMSFEARTHYLEQARFPHLGRASRPGGIDRSTAEQNIGKLLQDTPALEIPILPVYDIEVHLWVTERFMKAPEYLKLPPPQQQQFMLHWFMLTQAQQAQMQMLAARAAAQQITTQIAAAGAAESAAAPPGQPAEPGTGGPPQQGAGAGNPPTRRSA
jgi:hypothetical protein